MHHISQEYHNIASKKQSLPDSELEAKWVQFVHATYGRPSRLDPVSRIIASASVERTCMEQGKSCGCLNTQEISGLLISRRKYGHRRNSGMGIQAYRTSISLPSLSFAGEKVNTESKLATSIQSTESAN